MENSGKDRESSPSLILLVLDTFSHRRGLRSSIQMTDDNRVSFRFYINHIHTAISGRLILVDPITAFDETNFAA